MTKPIKVPARSITDGSQRWTHVWSHHPNDDRTHEMWLKNEEAWFQRHWWRRVYRRVVLAFGGRP